MKPSIAPLPEQPTLYETENDIAPKSRVGLIDKWLWFVEAHSQATK